MRGVTDKSAELLSAITALNKVSKDLTKEDICHLLPVVTRLAEYLDEDIKDMDHINALHEFYLAKSEWAEGLQVEID